MKNPFANDKYKKLKEKLQIIVEQWSKMYPEDNQYFDVANWLSADIIDAINEVENEKTS
jgi:hypothetical protein